MTNCPMAITIFSTTLSVLTSSPNCPQGAVKDLGKLPDLFFFFLLPVNNSDPLWKKDERIWTASTKLPTLTFLLVLGLGSKTSLWIKNKTQNTYFYTTTHLLRFKTINAPPKKAHYKFLTKTGPRSHSNTFPFRKLCSPTTFGLEMPERTV